MTGKSKPWDPGAGRATSAACADVAALTRRQQPALALVPRDPICSLRFRGSDHDTVDLPTAQHRFVIGSAPTCDVVVPRELATAVSACHAAMERTGTGFVVRDLASKNGTYRSLGEARRESVAVEPGDTFWVANVGVTVTDGTLDVLRAHVLCHVGLDDVAAVDQAMDDIASGTPLLLRGPVGTGARRLARYVHATSPQRANPRIVGPAPACLLKYAQGTTVYLDLTDLPALPARYAARLLDPASGLRVIFAAPDERRARACLDHLRDRVRTVALVPLARRREEAPYLMQLYWATALRSTRRVDELGEAGGRALAKYAWPRNLDELFDHSVRLLGYLEHGGLRAAAAALGIAHQTLHDHFARIGFPVLDQAERELPLRPRKRRAA